MYMNVSGFEKKVKLFTQIFKKNITAAMFDGQVRLQNAISTGTYWKPYVGQYKWPRTGTGPGGKGFGRPYTLRNTGAMLRGVVAAFKPRPGGISKGFYLSGENITDSIMRISGRPGRLPSSYWKIFEYGCSNYTMAFKGLDPFGFTGRMVPAVDGRKPHSPIPATYFISRTRNALMSEVIMGIYDAIAHAVKLKSVGQTGKGIVELQSTPGAHGRMKGSYITPYRKMDKAAKQASRTRRKLAAQERYRSSQTIRRSFEAGRGKAGIRQSREAEAGF